MPLPNQFDDAHERAIRYRDETDARISFRANILRRLRGSGSAWEQLWNSWRPIYDKTNYIETPSEGGMPTPFDDGSYMTPYDIDDNGAISSSPLRLRNTRHASDQNDRPHGA
jgi:hypothetical protein